jgi:glycosyltransferase involved in cell wall biosynthesis
LSNVLSHAETDSRPDVSIVVPVYNEAHRIADTITEMSAFMTSHAIDAELLFVDDGSTDATRAIISNLAVDAPHITLIAADHFGKANAVLTGLRASRGAIVGFMDADLATPLETFFACRDRLADGFGVAIASREGKGSHRIGEPHYRHIMGRAFNGFVRTLLLPGIHDTQCGFKFFSRSAIDAILPRTRLYADARPVSVARVTAFDVELLFIARSLGYRIAIIPITWTYGTHSKVNPVLDTLNNARDVLLVRWHGLRGHYR